VGIGFLASSTVDTRANTISAYNSAKSAWDGGGSASFAATQYSLVLSPQILTYTLQLAPDSSNVDNLPSGIDAVATPVRFVGTTATLKPFLPISPASGRSDTTEVLKLNPGGNLVDVSLFQPAYSMIDCTSSDTDAACRARCPTSAVWSRTDPNTCYTGWKVATEFCFVVDPAAHTFVAGMGCFPNGDKVRYYSSSNPGYTSFSSLQVTLRASTDPYVVLIVKTSGTMTLPLSVETKKSIGTSLLVIGIVLAATMGIWVGILKCKKK